MATSGAGVVRGHSRRSRGMKQRVVLRSPVISAYEESVPCRRKEPREGTEGDTTKPKGGTTQRCTKQILERGPLRERVCFLAVCDQGFPVRPRCRPRQDATLL